MMKKTLVALLLLLGFNGFAQSTVVKGLTYYNDLDTPSYSFASTIDDKEMATQLEKYLDQYGNVTDLKKKNYRLDKIKGNKWSSELESIEVKIEAYKKFNKVIFYYLGKNKQSVDIRDLDAIEFIENYMEYIKRQEELRLYGLNLKQAEEDQTDAVKESEKIQRQIEKNLKEQEKLGKKLDASPESMSKALAEKEEIVGQIFNESTQEKEKDALSKASTDKEKEIQKIKKEKEKAESKLSKKETEFDVLKNELFAAKRKVKAMEAVKKDAENNFRKIEKLAKMI